MKWKVRLTGRSLDLSALAGMFTEPELHVGRDKKGYFLAGSMIDAIDSPQEVRLVAQESLNRMNGPARLDYQTHQGVEAETEIDEDDGRTHKFLVTGTAVTRSRASAELSGGRPVSTATNHQRPATSDYLDLPRADPEVGRPEVSRDQARHEISRGSPPRRAMTEPQAFRFIGMLVKYWLEMRRCGLP